MHTAAASSSSSSSAAPSASSRIDWRQHTLRAPAFLHSLTPALAQWQWIYSYPSFFYVPPAQRRPLALVWGTVALLCILRLLGLVGGAARFDDAWLDSSRHDSLRRGGHHARSSHPHPDAGRHDEHSGGGTDYSRRRAPLDDGLHVADGVNALFTLVPFLLFFLVPMLQRWMQQQRQQPAR